jgi:hypothetical protein
MAAACRVLSWADKLEHDDGVHASPPLMVILLAFEVFGSSDGSSVTVERSRRSIPGLYSCSY